MQPHKLLAPLARQGQHVQPELIAQPDIADGPPDKRRGRAHRHLDQLAPPAVSAARGFPASRVADFTSPSSVRPSPTSALLSAFDSASISRMSPSRTSR